MYFTVPDSLNCILGLHDTSELRSMWENRHPPVVYTSPYITMPLSCMGRGTVINLLAGAYEVTYGVDETSAIVNSEFLCDLSSQPADANINVYECILNNPNRALINSFQIYQRNSHIPVVSIHDGETDITVVSIEIGKWIASINFKSYVFYFCRLSM